ncbi:hypothetical protein L7F22_026010 [Adiantum nelumboides]|nr:hypothetical protein [Adiantum nelumboides]
MAQGRNFKCGGDAKTKTESDVNTKLEKEISVQDLGQHTPKGKSAMGGKKGGKRRLRFSKRGGAGKKGSIEPVKDFSGLIFMCNTATKKDCFKHHVFGPLEAKKVIEEKAKKGMKLFLFDIDQKVLYGVYMASSHGEMNLVSEDFQDLERKFSAQFNRSGSLVSGYWLADLYSGFDYRLLVSFLVLVSGSELATGLVQQFS